MAFIKLDRKYFDNFLWNEARVYSKAEAWLDLIQFARIEANKEFVNGKMIEVQRGEIPASRRFLELRWQWGSSKVSNFLKLLVSQGMITTKQTNGQTVISLCKYRDYNNKQTTDKPPTNQIEEYKKIRIEEDSNVESEKEFSPHSPTSENSDFQKARNQNPPKSETEQRKKVPPKKESIEQRAERFKDDIWALAKGTDYATERDELRKFWEYWSEHGTRDRKMRFEKQTSFSIARRLRTWFDNVKKFRQNENKTSQNGSGSLGTADRTSEAMQRTLAKLEKESRVSY